LNWRSSLSEAQGLWRSAAAMDLPAADRLKYGLSYYLSRRGVNAISPSQLTIKLPRPPRGDLRAIIRTNGCDHHTLADLFQRRLYFVHATNVRRVLDLGANIGLSALFFVSCFPEAEVACVEPSPDNCRILRALVARKQNKGAVIEAAIGPETGQIELHLTSDPSSFSVVPARTGDRRIVVDQVTVPDVLDRLGWPDVDLLKIDIEGYERVLFSRRNTWLNRVTRIIGEAHGHVGYGIDQVRADLVPFGFTVECRSYDAQYALTVFEASKPEHRFTSPA
jgi:FkbM family methyltransferase